MEHFKRISILFLYIILSSATALSFGPKKPSDPKPPPSNALHRISMVDETTRRVLREIEHRQIVSLLPEDFENLNIRIDTRGIEVKSAWVKWDQLDPVILNSKPYWVFENAQHAAYHLSEASHFVHIRLYSDSDARGTLIEEHKVSFRIHVIQPAPPPPVQPPTPVEPPPPPPVQPPTPVEPPPPPPVQPPPPVEPPPPPPPVEPPPPPPPVEPPPPPPVQPPPPVEPPPPPPVEPPPPLKPGNWRHQGVVSEGGQMDVAKGPNNILHMISNRYSQIDYDGRVLLVDGSVGDRAQTSMSFAPAIAVGTDNSVHIVTRNSGAHSTDVRYARRSPSGQWVHNYIFRSAEERSYVVGVADDFLGNTHMTTSTSSGESNRIYKENNGRSSLLGTLTRLWRPDTDVRMRGASGYIYLAIGKVDPSGFTTFTWGRGGNNLFNEMNANKKTHRAGSGRKGFPDIYIDHRNSVHFIYGSQHEVYYNKYNSSHQKIFSNDIRIFSGLGNWHLNTGMATVASSDDGQFVVAVALKSDGSARASNSELIWSYSENGGRNWAPAKSLGKRMDAGEGRRRPRLVAIGDKFFLFFIDKASEGKVSLSTLEFN